MSKTKEELNALKEEVETMSKKLHELTDEELEQVSGGKVKTQMKCSACGRSKNWAGMYLNESYGCPFCGAENTFTGVELC